MITDFNIAATSESTEALCSDGNDNDEDGLADCQDWKCLNMKGCCDIPAILLEDDFEAEDCAKVSCDQATAECLERRASRWKWWGVPNPKVCDRALWPSKLEQCYPVGVLGQEQFQLRPGLRVEIGIKGRPEPAGKLEIGLTFNSETSLFGHIDPCGVVDAIRPIVSVTQKRSSGGYQFVARFGQQELDASREVPTSKAEERQALRIYIGEDKLVHYELNGEQFAESPSDRPITATTNQAFLYLVGLGKAARFDDVRVATETQCDTPGTWQKSRVFEAWAGSPSEASWDSYQVYHPDVVAGDNRTIQMFYTGCTRKQGKCDNLKVGIGKVVTQEEGFQALNNQALFFSDQVFSEGAEGLNLHVAVSKSWLRAFISDADNKKKRGIKSFELTSALQVPDGMSIGQILRDAIVPGGENDWDGGGTCCATAVVRKVEGADRQAIERTFVWYAGKGTKDDTWRIGLATSDDKGLTFAKSPRNPVFTEGLLDEFDGRGVTDPEVAWDERRGLYRMWYKAEPFLGKSSIGYAVSPDGVTWHRYSGNPVIDPEGAGLDHLGSPTVILHDGGFRLWVHGKAPSTNPQFRIYSFENTGKAFEETP
ncbi:MAG: hypothetical protein HY698_04770 [Deltaproteobacteria bacterium]|nr:hypothetical protein [Deltaproteobacteria bacterium]